MSFPHCLYPNRTLPVSLNEPHSVTITYRARGAVEVTVDEYYVFRTQVHNRITVHVPTLSASALVTHVAAPPSTKKVQDFSTQVHAHTMQTESEREGSFLVRLLAKHV